MASDPLEETNLTGGWLRDYVFFNGQRIAARTPSSAVLAFFDNHLGSTSKLEEIASTGSVTQGFDADYYPFGRAHQFTDSYDPAFKFEGKERDAESGLDNFGARFYTSNIGRFMSADWSAVPAPVPYANLTNPQTLNLYAMVSDNPETFADLDGHLSGNEGQCWVDFCGGNVSLDMGPNQALEGEGFAPPPQKTGDGLGQSEAQQAVTANEQADQQNQAQQQNTDTVTVEEVKGQGVNGGPFGFNHAAISVDGKQAVGLEQKKDCGTCAVEDKTTPGAVKPVDPKRTILSHATIHITRDQARRIQTFLDKAAKSPPNYNLYHSNCAQFCEAALGAGRVKAPSDVTPAGLVGDLRKLYPQQ